MTPLDYYQNKIATGEILADSQQLCVMHKLQQLYLKLTAPKSFLDKFKKKPLLQGLYLWGSVGVGKTFLIDTFYYALPFDEKCRLHFYAFMRAIHADLHRLKGIKDPLTHVAITWAKKTRVICFDEFFISDIADALLLKGVFNAFLHQGIYLICSSNFAPDELYKNGVQRQLFLPAIAQIKTKLEVIHLAITDDFRANPTYSLQYYFCPLTVEAESKMAQCFKEFSHAAIVDFKPLVILGREVQIKKRAAKVIWFDFLAICGIPRSYEDYLAIVKEFNTILVSNVTAIGPTQSDLARSFIRFVDVLYDANVRLIISSAQPIEKIYTSGQLLFEFTRTCSRLTQMQSAQWVEMARS